MVPLPLPPLVDGPRLQRELDGASLQACKTGVPEAQRAFIVCYQAAVFALLSRLLGHGADVEDLAQETFIRALRALPMQQREAFILMHGEKLDVRAIAVAMDCSVLAAGNHLNEATDRLRHLAGSKLESHASRLASILVHEDVRPRSGSRLAVTRAMRAQAATTSSRLAACVPVSRSSRRPTRPRVSSRKARHPTRSVRGSRRGNRRSRGRRDALCFSCSAHPRCYCCSRASTSRR